MLEGAEDFQAIFCKSLKWLVISGMGEYSCAQQLVGSYGDIELYDVNCV
jgi:hypothetical protein